MTNDGFPPFFEFGTPVAMMLVFAGWSDELAKVQGNYTMSAFEFASNKALAAVFAIGASAIMMAYAIVPASPAGLIA